MACITDTQDIKYCMINDEWYVGTNTSSAYSRNTPTTITIPEYIQGNSIKYIGAYAFNQNTALYSVTIKAKIVLFHTHAFGNCPNLAYINIPSTVERLEHDSIQCYNNNPQLRKGILIVSFDLNPQIKYIDGQVFAFKEFTHIYICEKIFPQIASSVLAQTKTIIYAPVSFSFHNI